MGLLRFPRVALQHGLALALVCLPVHAQQPGFGGSAGAASQAADADLLLLDVRLDGHVLVQSMTAYQHGRHLLLPLGELARRLGLALAVEAREGRAAGFVLREDREFGLNVAAGVVGVGGLRSDFDRSLVRLTDEDIYVSHLLLADWLPIDFELNTATLHMDVRPREVLPMQARLERERAAARLSGVPAQPEDPGYPHQREPYRLLSDPFIDQTFGGDARFGRGTRQRNAAYTAFITADVLGMEGSAYISSTREDSRPDTRVTLGRHDPQGQLLGPLAARSFSVGDVLLPGVSNLTRGSSGNGLVISNRPLDTPTSFDRQSLRGDLPPGWDVTLYYNDALLGYQQGRADGRYAFDDLPLAFGSNEFLLVFNGPLGQMRTERRSFMLDVAQVKPGEWNYVVGQQRGEDGATRRRLAADFGLARQWVATGGLIQVEPGASRRAEATRQYLQAGVRGYWRSFILSSQVNTSRGGGRLAELGLKTNLGSYALDFQHLVANSRFSSEAFPDEGDAMRWRHRARVTGALDLGWRIKFPVAAEVQRDVLRSGKAVDGAGARISATVFGTAITNSQSWQRIGGKSSLHGGVQLSRRISDVGLSANIGYALVPQGRLNALTIAADKTLPSGYRVSANFLRSFDTRTSVLSGGVSKNFDSFALAVTGSYSSRGERAVGLQIFMALGREPRSGRWFADALPMAGTGSVSARAFVDRNLNGTHDPGEEFVPNASFVVNSGSRHPDPTGEDGTTFIGRLPPGRWADLALDPRTLEDPQWKPALAGFRVLPRPGMTQALDFPVVSTSDIDGTVILVDKGRQRPVANALIELVNEAGTIVMTTRSSSDGFYLFHQVLPGHYALRISPQQQRELGVAAALERRLKIGTDADFISGQDFELRRFRELGSGQ